MFYDPFMCGVLLGAIFGVMGIMTYIEYEREQNRQRSRYLQRKRNINKLIAKSRALRHM